MIIDALLEIMSSCDTNEWPVTLSHFQVIINY